MKRWPVIRHIRWWLTMRQINRWYAMWERFGYFATNSHLDYAEADRIWRGEA